jgi:pimeloyl-ACP methyl ester carboxylesterase
MPLHLKEHSFKAGPVTLNYVEGPETGPPLVLLHGGSARWQAFESIMPELAARWHLYGPDLRGHGQSGRAAANGYRLQDYSADIVAFLRAQVQEPAMLSALLDDFDTVAAGYQMEQVLPAIRCPVLLLQADPKTGGVMTDAEMVQALPLLADPTHIKLDGISHVLHNEQPEPVLRAMIDFLEALPN